MTRPTAGAPRRAPVAPGTFVARPIAASWAKMANATASLASLSMPSSEVVRTGRGVRRARSRFIITAFREPPPSGAGQHILRIRRPVPFPSGGLRRRRDDKLVGAQFREQPLVDASLWGRVRAAG